MWMFFALMGFGVVMAAFLVIVRSLSNTGIALLRMEYLLSREFELVEEKERIKKNILRRQSDEEAQKKKREEELDPLAHLPTAAKKKAG